MISAGLWTAGTRVTFWAKKMWPIMLQTPLASWWAASMTASRLCQPGTGSCKNRCVAAIIRSKINSAGKDSASANAGSRACSAIDDPSNGTRMRLMEKGSSITWGWIMSLAQQALCRTLLATLPYTQRLTPERPWLDIIIRSISFS